MARILSKALLNTMHDPPKKHRPLHMHNVLSISICHGEKKAEGKRDQGRAKVLPQLDKLLLNRGKADMLHTRRKKAGGSLSSLVVSQLSPLSQNNSR